MPVIPELIMWNQEHQDLRPYFSYKITTTIIITGESENTN